MLQVRWLDDDGATAIGLDELRRRLEGSDVAGFGWVDVPVLDPADRAPLRSLGLPELAIEDLIDDRHQPKVDRVGDVVVLVVHGLDLDTLGDELRTVELDVVVADRLLVTCHDGRVASLAALAERADEGALVFDRPLVLLHRLLDTMNDVFVPFVEHLDRRLDLIEEEVLDDPTEATRRDIYALQRDLIQLRRVVVPQAEVVRRLQREQPPGWREGDAALVRDLVDHLSRIAELSASYQALLDSAMTSYRYVLISDISTEGCEDTNADGEYDPGSDIMYVELRDANGQTLAWGSTEEYEQADDPNNDYNDSSYQQVSKGAS